MENLTFEERKKLYSVIALDYEVRAKEREKLINLKLELDSIRMQSLQPCMYNDELNRHLYEDMKKKTCYRCCITFGNFKLMLDPLKICIYCKQRVCKNCIVTIYSTKSQHLCVYCSKLKEIEEKSGAWFYSNIMDELDDIDGSKIIKDALINDLEGGSIKEKKTIERMKTIMYNTVNNSMENKLELDAVNLVQRNIPSTIMKSGSSDSVSYSSNGLSTIIGVTNKTNTYTSLKTTTNKNPFINNSNNKQVSSSSDIEKTFDNTIAINSSPNINHISESIKKQVIQGVKNVAIPGVGLNPFENDDTITTDGDPNSKSLRSNRITHEDISNFTDNMLSKKSIEEWRMCLEENSTKPTLDDPLAIALPRITSYENIGKPHYSLYLKNPIGHDISDGSQTEQSDEMFDINTSLSRTISNPHKNNVITLGAVDEMLDQTFLRTQSVNPKLCLPTTFGGITSKFNNVESLPKISNNSTNLPSTDNNDDDNNNNDNDDNKTNNINDDVDIIDSIISAGVMDCYSSSKKHQPRSSKDTPKAVSEVNFQTLSKKIKDLTNTTKKTTKATTLKKQKDLADISKNRHKLLDIAKSPSVDTSMSFTQFNVSTISHEKLVKLPHLYGSISVHAEGFDKYSIYINIEKITQLTPLPCATTTSINSYVICKLKSGKQFMEKKTKPTENNSNPIINNVIKFYNVTNLDTSYVLFIIKEKSTKKILSKKRDDIYGTIRLGATSFCRDDEKEIWNQLMFNAKINKIVDIPFVLPILSMGDMEINSYTLGSPYDSTCDLKNTSLSSISVNSGKINISNVGDVDVIKHDKVKINGYLNFDLFYNMETSEIKITIKNLLIENSILNNEAKLFIKCKLTPQDHVSKFTSFKFKNSDKNIIDWNESISYEIKYSNLQKYEVSLRILQESQPNTFDLCGSIQFLLTDIMEYFPGFVTNPIGCHMKIHQNYLATSYSINSNIHMELLYSPTSFGDIRNSTGKLKLKITDINLCDLEQYFNLSDQVSFFFKMVLLPYTSEKLIIDSPEYTIKGEFAPFEYCWEKVSFDYLLHKNCIEINIYLINFSSNELYTFIGGTRIGSVQYLPPTGEEWQDSLGDEQLIWNEMISKPDIIAKRKIPLRNNMVTNYIDQITLIESPPPFFIDKIASFFDFKYYVEINLTFHGDDSLTLFIGNVLNLPIDTSSACMIAVMPKKQKFTLVPSHTTFYNWNQSVEIHNVHGFDEISIVITFGEILNDSSKPLSHRTGKVHCKLNKENIYGKLYLGLLKNAKYDSFFYYEQTQHFIRQCLQKKGKRMCAFFPLLDDNYLKNCYAYNKSYIRINPTKNKRDASCTINELTPGDSNTLDNKNKRTSFLDKVSSKFKKSITTTSKNTFDNEMASSTLKIDKRRRKAISKGGIDLNKRQSLQPNSLLFDLPENLEGASKLHSSPISNRPKTMIFDNPGSPLVTDYNTRLIKDDIYTNASHPTLLTNDTSIGTSRPEITEKLPDTLMPDTFGSIQELQGVDQPPRNHDILSSNDQKVSDIELIQDNQDDKILENNLSKLNENITQHYPPNIMNESLNIALDKGTKSTLIQHEIDDPIIETIPHVGDKSTKHEPKLTSFVSARNDDHIKNEINTVAVETTAEEPITRDNILKHDPIVMDSPPAQEIAKVGKDKLIDDQDRMESNLTVLNQNENTPTEVTTITPDHNKIDICSSTTIIEQENNHTNDSNLIQEQDKVDNIMDISALEEESFNKNTMNSITENRAINIPPLTPPICENVNNLNDSDFSMNNNKIDIISSPPIEKQIIDTNIPNLVQEYNKMDTTKKIFSNETINDTNIIPLINDYNQDYNKADTVTLPHENNINETTSPISYSNKEETVKLEPTEFSNKNSKENAIIPVELEKLEPSNITKVYNHHNDNNIEMNEKNNENFHNVSNLKNKDFNNVDGENSTLELKQIITSPNSKPIHTKIKNDKSMFNMGSSSVESGSDNKLIIADNDNDIITPMGGSLKLSLIYEFGALNVELIEFNHMDEPDLKKLVIRIKFMDQDNKLIHTEKFKDILYTGEPCIISRKFAYNCIPTKIQSYNMKFEIYNKNVKKLLIRNACMCLNDVVAGGSTIIKRLALVNFKSAKSKYGSSTATRSLLHDISIRKDSKSVDLTIDERSTIKNNSSSGLLSRSNMSVDLSSSMSSFSMNINNYITNLDVCLEYDTKTLHLNVILKHYEIIHELNPTHILDNNSTISFCCVVYMGKIKQNWWETDEYQSIKSTIDYNHSFKILLNNLKKRELHISAYIKKRQKILFGSTIIKFEELGSLFIENILKYENTFILTNNKINTITSKKYLKNINESFTTTTNTTVDGTFQSTNITEAKCPSVVGMIDSKNIYGDLVVRLNLTLKNQDNIIPTKNLTFKRKSMKKLNSKKLSLKSANVPVNDSVFVLNIHLDDFINYNLPPGNKYKFELKFKLDKTLSKIISPSYSIKNNGDNICVNFETDFPTIYNDFLEKHLEIILFEDSKLSKKTLATVTIGKNTPNIEMDSFWETVHTNFNNSHTITLPLYPLKSSKKHK